MSTEILGYLTAPHRPTHKPTQRRKNQAIHISHSLMQKLTAVILMELGALTIPISDGDGTAFIFMLFLGIAIITGGKNHG